MSLRELRAYDQVPLCLPRARTRQWPLGSPERARGGGLQGVECSYLSWSWPLRLDLGSATSGGGQGRAGDSRRRTCCRWTEPGPEPRQPPLPSPGPPGQREPAAGRLLRPPSRLWAALRLASQPAAEQTPHGIISKNPEFQFLKSHTWSRHTAWDLFPTGTPDVLSWDFPVLFKFVCWSKPNLVMLSSIVSISLFF